MLRRRRPHLRLLRLRRPSQVRLFQEAGPRTVGACHSEPALMRHKRRGAAAQPHSQWGGARTCLDRVRCACQDEHRKGRGRAHQSRAALPSVTRTTSTRIPTTTLASGCWSASSVRVGFVLCASAGLAALGSDPPGIAPFFGPWLFSFSWISSLSCKAGGAGWLQGASQEERCV